MGPGAGSMGTGSTMMPGGSIGLTVTLPAGSIVTTSPVELLGLLMVELSGLVTVCAEARGRVE